jgi:LytR cell envelope-related transcriptional attenuator
VAASPSGSRPLLRTGGIALLGVGVIAATIGLFTSASSGNGTGTAVPSSSSQALFPSGQASAVATAPVAPAPTESVVAAPPDAGAVSPGATAPSEPDGSAPPAAAEPPVAAPAPAIAAAPPAASGSGSGSGGGSTVRAPLRVYNNSLIQGLAARAKSDFESAGWTVTAISGYGEGVIAHSTVYFRPGTSEEAAAQELGREFGLHVEPRFPGIANSTDGVIVIVTEDYKPGKS